MDDFSIFWVAILLIGLILFSGIAYLIYFTFKAIGQPRLGKVIGLVILVGYSLFSFYTTFEDHFFFKYSARKELKELDLVLIDNFKIIRNESGGFTDYYHIFELKISNRDLKNLIKNKDLTSNVVTVRHSELENNSWKEVKIDTETNTLIFEYIIN